MSNSDDLGLRTPAPDVPAGLHTRLLGLLGSATTIASTSGTVLHDSFDGVSAGLRSVALSGERTLLVAGGDIELVLEVSAVDDGVIVTGQVLSGIEPGEVASVQIVDGHGVEVALAVLDEHGDVALGPFAPGTYELVVATPLGEVVLEDVELG